MSRDLVFEIGCEEIPARLMPEMLNQLKTLAENMFTSTRLSFAEATVMGTPRRLVLVVKDLAEETTPQEFQVKGPPAKAAFDTAGQPTRAAEGFARSQGVELSKLKVRTVDGGQYVFATKREEGRPTQQVLAEGLPALVRSLSFQRPMRWGSRELKFVRPIRWLLSLFGSEVVEFDIEGIRSDRYTFGHRFLAPGPFAASDAGDYFHCLERGFVVLAPEERKRIIRAQGDELANQIKGRVLWTEELLNEVTFLVEYPTALMGSFAHDYLTLPADVIITPMKDHQRYFPVVNKEGDLLPYFVAVRNGTADHLDKVREGNENVLRARLADARFFFEEDRKISLADRVKQLEAIVFQENLGTLYDKSQRLMALAQFLARRAGLDKVATSLVERAAFLAKADLTTNMVNEFPELQGLMGREYALLKGEHASVAQAIAEQYLPRFAGDELPATLSGALLAISDKIDTIVGCFGAGLIPTGSEDPYGLRRQANGSINIILDQELDLSLVELAEKAAALYEEQELLPRSANDVVAEVREFLTQRLRVVLEDRDLRYDVVDAVLAVLPEHPSQSYRRAELITQLRKEPFFANMLQAFVRVGNLACKAGNEELRPELLTEQAEIELYHHYLKLKDRVPCLVAEDRGREAIEQLSALAEPVDRFFTDVLVMAKEPKIRANRLSLLKAIRDLALSIADFSRLVSEA
ncbi:MAG TPA: glycine--tRNA ligase subunit beta [Firmicutes bacterium]|nr:glycine--tRNA ligase subunit beta [Bacillota bacterium]